MEEKNSVVDRLQSLNVPARLTGLCSAGEWRTGSGPQVSVDSAIDGATLTEFTGASPEDVDSAVENALHAFHDWRRVPAPHRGTFVREFGVELRRHKQDLGYVISWESGKILEEGEGEVQEMIDICDFATGLSRQLYGRAIASERPMHRLTEQWHPLGPVGVISAFNFPTAVWAWNAAIAFVCGDSLVWKPSEKTPLCAIACQTLLMRAAERCPGTPRGISSLIIGGSGVGQLLASDRRLPLISATGSCSMGKSVGREVASRLGRSLLELGGNNAMVVTQSANLHLAIQAAVFSAIGTAGQRCTSLRRLVLHEGIADEVVSKLSDAYQNVKVGSPLHRGVHMGPLIDESAIRSMQTALEAAVEQGGRLVIGGSVLSDGVPLGGAYVKPAIVEIEYDAPVVQEETFAPILYVHRYSGPVDEAIRINNSVRQGLSSSIFTQDQGEAEYFCSEAGSDCGIVNVNIGTSGAEIGGAFGGEKDTGGGREAGSDSWKSYMRRITNTVNFSGALPLAQGIRFEL